MNMEDSEAQEKIKVQQQINALEAVAKQFMSSEAIMRYGSLKSAYQQKALQSLALIATLAKQGQIKEKISDAQYKSLLMRLDEPKRETKIIRK